MWFSSFASASCTTRQECPTSQACSLRLRLGEKRDQKHFMLTQSFLKSCEEDCLRWE